MQSGKLNVVIDAFWGSCGKGKVCDWLAATRGVTDVISGNMPNAGHTIVRGRDKIVAKVMPSAAFFNPDTRVWLSASTGFFPARYLEEKSLLNNEELFLHERAFVVTEEHGRFEQNSMSHIASTMQGSAAALIDKIMRGQTSPLQNPSKYETVLTTAKEWRFNLLSGIRNGTALFEISQGWGLSIDHGTHYPHCTSRNCSVQRALDDCSSPPRDTGDVIAVVRPYPIRVGNTHDGHSGGFAEDNVEVSWEHVEKVSGCRDLAEKERTTVTKRIRRVSTFSFDLLSDCVRHNGVTGIFLNFAQYIDAACAGKRGKIADAPRAVRIFAAAIENETQIPVIALGTGADTFDVLEA